GRRVDHRPQVTGHRLRAGTDGRLNQPAQTTGNELVDLRRRDPDAFADRSGARPRGERVPVARMRASYPGLGEPGQLTGSRWPDDGGQAPVGGGPTKVSGQRWQG